MKLKCIFNKVVNSRNNQITLNPKKKLLRKLGYDDIDDILEMEMEDKAKNMLYRT